MRVSGFKLNSKNVNSVSEIGYSKGIPGSKNNSAEKSSLMDKLNALDSRELKPKTNAKSLDFMA